MHVSDNLAQNQATDFVDGGMIPLFEEMGPKGIA
jgi:hypothetical protein